jgi:aspartyl-tRNA(Asn)/glutamyl-tRNA(Gln) amidotransferase subunit A
MGPLHVGTDGGGSIRIPASFTGIFGLKPTFGRVPAFPHSPFGTLAHIGPMTRTVADAESMFRVLCEQDARDPCAVRPDYIEQQSPDGSQWSGKRVAFIERIAGIDVDPEVDGVVKSTLQKLEALGATVAPITLDDDVDIREIFRMHWYSGARQLARAFSNDDMARLDPGFREVVEESREFTLDECQDAAIRRIQISSRLEQLHDKFDVLVSATVPIKPFPVNQEVADPAHQRRWIDWAQYSYLFNLSQQPAASVPCGFTPDGCPVGLQIVGPRFSDYRLLGLCAGLEQALASA